MAAVKGYNISISVGGVTMVGVTQDDLNISVNTKESITKSDAGVKRKVGTSTTTTFKVAGVMDMSGNNSMLEKALGTSTVSVTYKHGSNDSTYTGTAIITGYTESTPADPDSDATYTLDLELIGSLS